MNIGLVQGSAFKVQGCQVEWWSYGVVEDAGRWMLDTGCGMLVSEFKVQRSELSGWSDA